MWIKHEGAVDPESPTGTRRLRHDEYTDGDDVAFNPGSGKAQVTSAIGEQLVNHYDAIVAVDETDTASESNSDAESDG